MDTDNKTAAALKSRFKDAVVSSETARGECSVCVRGEELVEICGFLKNEPSLKYDYLSDITAVDYLGKRVPRFEVVYHLYSMEHNQRIRLKVRVDDNRLDVPSVTGTWAGANWLEREAFDMFGISFYGHPDLRRILNSDEFDGYPLRKDFPLRGTKRDG